MCPAQNPPDAYDTLAGGGSFEIKIQRSRFLGCAAPAADEDSARTFIAEIARQHHDARHVCHAWRVGAPPGDASVRNDDGEPAGTGGEPILAAIRRSDLHDTVVAVVRWYGGVKLGTGGLSRAYGEAAEGALTAAPRRQVLLGRSFDLDFAYPRVKTVRHLLAGAGGRIEREDYGAAVSMTVWLPHSAWRGFVSAITEASGGEIRPRPVDPE